MLTVKPNYCFRPKASISKGFALFQQLHYNLSLHFTLTDSSDLISLLGTLRPLRYGHKSLPRDNGLHFFNHFPTKREFRPYCACLSLNGNRKEKTVNSTLVPRAAILLASATDRELWQPVPIRSRH